MKEKTIFYPAGKLRLEGLFAENAGKEGAVICHPHPQMGGSMESNVVAALSAALFFQGFSTLRFNFRGVGRSEGNFDHGIGEQEDIDGAVSWLKQKGKASVLPAGYSFGAWVGSKWLRDHEIDRPAILVSPPIEVMDFDFSALEGKVGLVICAGRDPYCDAGRMKEIARKIHSRFSLIPHADHFYFGNEPEIVDALNDYLTTENHE